MLHILVPELTPRVRYTFAVLTAEWGTPYALHRADASPVTGPTLHYGPITRPDAVNLPWQGLLSESAVRPVFAPWQWGTAETLCLFPQPDATGFDLAFDLPAAAFYLLSGYECYVAEYLDAHGRYDLAAYPSAHWHLDQWPWVARWADLLWDKLVARFPRLRRASSAPSVQITVDIDAPWKHRHKGPLLAWGGVGRALLRGDRRDLAERLRALLLGQDPYHTFDHLTALLPPAQTTFFALLARHSPHDTRYTWQHGPYRALLRHLAAQGYALGIHPSYTSCLCPARIAEEADRLRQMLGQPVTRSRQHFLRYRLPDTFRALLAAGLTDDYSLCRYDRGGFPHGMRRAFPWYDLLADRATALTLHPTHLMDRTLQQYLALPPAAAPAYAAQVRQRAQGGTFTLLLHNDSLSESGEWRGWRAAIEALVHPLT